MTRANVTIISHGSKFKFRIGSDGFPEEITPTLERFKDVEDSHNLNLPALVNALYLELGHVGNPCFIYELNLDTHVVTAWETKIRWVNAPDDWKERGWNCYIGKNGRYGYDTWVKGKKVSER